MPAIQALRKMSQEDLKFKPNLVYRERPCLKNKLNGKAVMANTFNPNSQAFEASLLYRASSRKAWATQRNPALKNQK